MTRSLCICALVLASACGGTDPAVITTATSTPAAGFVDHEGNPITIKSGFTDSYDDYGDTRHFLVLSNMNDACASLTWWARRDASLSDLFFADPFDEPGFLEAIDNTADVFADEMSTGKPWYAYIDLGPQPMGSEVSIPGATASSEWGDPVFWATATLLTTPSYESETSTTGGTFRTFGPDGYEADGVAGSLTLTLDAGGASGSIDTVFETDELAQFDFTTDFDVAPCTDWMDAY